MFHQSLSHCARCTLKLPTITTSQRRFLLQSASMMRQYKRTHYEVLGLPPSATQTEIRDAFVKLSKETHPDMNPDDPHNHVKFVQLNEAYTTLSKLHSRKAYDLSLAYMSRSAASSHTVGPMYSPGTGVRTDFHDGNQQNERVFWDETIWEMRDKSKDKHAFYPPDSYYGIKGIPKQSNGVVAAVICISIATLSVAHFIFGIMWSKKKSRETVEKIDRKNLRILKEVEERARINGSAKQLELLRLKVAEFEAAKAKARLARTSDS